LPHFDVVKNIKKSKTKKWKDIPKGTLILYTVILKQKLATLGKECNFRAYLLKKVDTCN
jgi:hypothetical protein